MSNYPKVKDVDLVGSYPGFVKSGGGYVWDEVLEYRVWCHPHDDTTSAENDDDCYFVFGTYEEALTFSGTTPGAEAPLALILQEEYINELEPGKYIHVTSLSACDTANVLYRT